MPKFSETSLRRLYECHEDLQTVFKCVIIIFDCSIICGERKKREQNIAYHSGKSKVKFPDSNHNKKTDEPDELVKAVDAVPCPINWKQTKRMRYFAGFVVAIGEVLYAQGKIKHRIRWGGDWDMDTDLSDQRFDDLPHFEIIEE